MRRIIERVVTVVTTTTWTITWQEDSPPPGSVNEDLSQPQLPRTAHRQSDISRSAKEESNSEAKQ